MKKRFSSGCACLAVLFAVSSATGEPPVRIEEDWELHVTQPDAQIDAPQVVTMLLPAGETSDLILQVNLNHAATPQFSRGGIQIQATDGVETLAQVRLFDSQVLDQASETIRWTQVLQQAGSGIYFGVVAGSSSSWGAFGDNSTFVYVPHATAGLTTLAAYNPQASIDNSSVTYANNRVAWFRLKKVRFFSPEGTVTEWTYNADIE